MPWVRDSWDRYSRSMYGIVCTSYILILLPYQVLRYAVLCKSQAGTQKHHYKLLFVKKQAPTAPATVLVRYSRSVLLFYMAAGTLPHVEVMTPLSTLSLSSHSVYFYYIQSYRPGIVQLRIPWYQHLHECFWISRNWKHVIRVGDTLTRISVQVQGGRVLQGLVWVGYRLTFYQWPNVLMP